MMFSILLGRVRDFYVRSIFSYDLYSQMNSCSGSLAARRSGLNVGLLVRELFGGEDGKAFIEGLMHEYSHEFGLEFDYDKVQEECRWLLDKGVVFANHHNWQEEPLCHVNEMKFKAHEAFQRGVQEENNEFLKIPVVFIFSAGSIFIEVDQWPEDFDTGLNEHGRKELARITGLEEENFLQFYWQTYEKFWGHKHIAPKDYLKAVKIANLAARMHGNPDFQSWFNRDRLLQSNSSETEAVIA